MQTNNSRHLKMPFHIVKRLDMSKRNYWIIKVIGFVFAFLCAGIICTIFKPGTFGKFYERMILGCFDPQDFEAILSFVETAGLLLLVAFALAPAFKMKFWNIGAEGQISVGCLATAGLTYLFEKNKIHNDALIIVICLVAAILAGIIWALLPAIFKALFNTNETLFTLMMNYIATALISICISFWITNGTQVFPALKYGSLETIIPVKYLMNIIVVAVVVAIMVIYLKKTKHGYELSVVGASVNTARYVGINVKKVIIRTMILSGAISGLVGFLLVAGHHHTLSASIANGRGFTGVLVAWLGQFEPINMVVYAFLVAFFQCGSTYAASSIGMSKVDFSAIVTGMFFLIVIACEFFVNYRILIADDSKLNSFVLKCRRFINELLYGSDAATEVHAVMQTEKVNAKKNIVAMNEQYPIYVDKLDFGSASINASISKEVVLEKKNEYLAAKKDLKDINPQGEEKEKGLERIDTLNDAYKQAKLDLKWKNYFEKKSAKVKKSLLSVYKRVSGKKEDKQFMTWAVFVAFIAKTIKAAAIFIFGSTGETITEKSGHLNMGIPGIMYLGALGGILGERIYVDSVHGGPLNGFMIIFMPIIFAMLFAALGGLLFAFFTVTLKCNHNVTGLTLTTFGVGLSCYFIGLIDPMGINDAGLQLQSLFKSDWGDNWFGTIFLSQSFFTYLAVIVAIITAIILAKTKVGLNLRACGENPAAADAAGINVDRYRYIATIIGAAIAGLGGMVLELDLYVGYFNPRDAVDAFGWLALSLVIFSMWKPGICIGASFIFGALQQLRFYLGITPSQQQIFSVLPYAFTIIVLIVTSVFNKKNAQPPAALGVTYFREDR